MQIIINVDDLSKYLSDEQLQNIVENKVAEIIKEIESYHKYFNKYKSSWSDGTSSKDDFTQSDKLLELKIIARERGIGERKCKQQ